MSTGTEIIQGALKKIGAHSIASPAHPTTIVEGMGVLNSMLQLWRSVGIMQDIVPLQTPADELGEPADAKNGIIANLALEMAPDFSNGQIVRVTPQLKINAQKGYALIEDLYEVVTIPKKVPSSTLPRGSGNQKGNWERTFFDSDNEALDG